jgi:hypothetical protein
VVECAQPSAVLMSAKNVGMLFLGTTVDRKRITVMPVAKRPELLALALERLAAARNLPEVHIYADAGANLSQIEWARDTYLPEAFLFSARTRPAVPSGCWNILNAINEGGKLADEVYLVEEDVMVYPHFFEWHATQVSDVSCGRKIPRFDLYTNPGTCFRRPVLDALRPHVCDEYFQDTEAYCQRFQPVHSSTLDDGLIRRVIAEHGLTVSFPEKPVCAHQGIRGLGLYDIYQIEGSTMAERVESVRKILADPPQKVRYAKEWEEYRP